jgi:hypothetical protein
MDIIIADFFFVQFTHTERQHILLALYLGGERRPKEGESIRKKGARNPK